MREIHRGCVADKVEMQHMRALQQRLLFYCKCYWHIVIIFFQSPCCGKEYPCRLCHDENESHKIDRHNITEINQMLQMPFLSTSKLVLVYCRYSDFLSLPTVFVFVLFFVVVFI